MRPSGNKGDVPRTEEDGGARVGFAGLFRPEVREARGVDCCDEDRRAERRPEGVDMTYLIEVYEGSGDGGDGIRAKRRGTTNNRVGTGSQAWSRVKSST